MTNLETQYSAIRSAIVKEARTEDVKEGRWLPLTVQLDNLGYTSELVSVSAMIVPGEGVIARTITERVDVTPIVCTNFIADVIPMYVDSEDDDAIFGILSCAYPNQEDEDDCDDDDEDDGDEDDGDEDDGDEDDEDDCDESCKDCKSCSTPESK